MHSNDPEAESARVLLNLLQARQVPIHLADKVPKQPGV